MQPQGRVGDKSQVPADAHGCGGCPHPAIGPAIAGSSDVIVNCQPALRLDDPGIHIACCGPNTWTAIQGSSSVLINGKPAHRQNDLDRHCGGIGRLVEGSPDVLVGGPPTAISVADQVALTITELLGTKIRQGDDIAAKALALVGSKDYLLAEAAGNYPKNKNKCNKLPADVIERSTGKRPSVPKGGLQGSLGITRDPTAHEWADPNVKITGWSEPRPVSEARPGDVIAQQHNKDGPWGHVGVVAAPGQTVSVNSAVQPEGLVTNNNWGFRPAGENGESANDPPPVVRHYTGENE